MTLLKIFAAAAATIFTALVLVLACAALGKHLLMPALFNALLLIGFGENSAALVALFGTLTALLAGIISLAVELGSAREGDHV